MTSEAWRIETHDTVREVVITRDDRGAWRAPDGYLGASARIAVQAWAFRNSVMGMVLAPGEPTRAEAVAAERERCARLCDEVADEAQRETREARGDTLTVEWFKGRRSGAREGARKIRAGGV